MSACSFERLLQLLSKQLDLDGQLGIYDHLDRCDICHDAVYQISRDRDEALFIYYAHRVTPQVVRTTSTQQEDISVCVDEHKRSCSSGGEQNHALARLKGAQPMTSPSVLGSERPVLEDLKT